MNNTTLLIVKNSGVATIILNRPEVLNTLHPIVLSELKATLQEIGKDDDVRVVVIKGSGRCFCAGLDLKVTGEWIEEGNEEALKSQLINTGLEIERIIENMRQPVIAAVHGYAITGGFYLAYCCDLIIASVDAIFQDTHARWGLVPGWYESQRLMRLVGIPKARFLFYTSERVTAKEAESWGLVSKVVPQGELDKAIDTITARILQQSPASLAIIKAQLNQGVKADWATSLKIDEFIRTGLLSGFITEDAAQRLKDFREKRAKAWES